MIDGDVAQRRIVEARKGDRWLVEIGWGVAERDWIVWVGGVAADIANNAKISLALPKKVLSDEFWYVFVEINAIHKDIGFTDLLKWASLRCFCHIELDQVGFRNPNLATELQGASSTTAQSPYHDDFRQLITILLDYSGQIFLHFSVQIALVGIRFLPGEQFLACVFQLPRPIHQC